MNLDRLRALLPPDLAREVDALWDDFRREHGDDVDAFVTWLNARGRLSTDTMRDVLLSGEVSFTLSEAVGATPTGRAHDLIGLLGKGAMGEVHIGRDRTLNRNVAVKRMDPSLTDQPVLVRRFLAEAQVTGQLDHPGIVPVHTLARDDDGALSYAMKLVRGETLTAYLARTRAAYDEGGVPDEEHALEARLEIFLQVCGAMAYAHARGVLHRDLKPDNIMVGAFHEVLVMDWGIAKLVGATDEDLSAVDLDSGRAMQTQLGIAVGTAPYMSPEQAQGLNDQLGPASDQYALGLILYEIVSLRRAVVAPHAMATLFRAAEGMKQPLVPYHKKEPVPPELAAIIDKATARDPDKRYPSVEALADDVRRFLRDEAVLARPDTPAQRVQRWFSHHRQATLGIVLGLVVLVFAVGATAVAGGLLALEASRQAAQAREARLGELTAAVDAQARQMDTEMLRYQALLTGLAFTAERVLEQPAPDDVPVWRSVDIDAGLGPPDLAPSRVYRSDISLDHPDITLAPDVDADAVDPRLRQLASLQPALRRVQLRSHSEGLLSRPRAQQDALIRDRGVPLVWAYLATEDGILAGYPGVGGYPDDYDPRTRPWYRQGASSREPTWGAIDVDESGMGLLVTCTRGLYGADDTFLGTAAIDITFGFLIDRLLDPPFEGEAFLVDADGDVVVRSRQKDRARDAETYTTPPFPWPGVRDLIVSRDAGGHRQEGDDLLVWTPLQAGGWTYVVVGDADALLD